MTPVASRMAPPKMGMAKPITTMTQPAANRLMTLRIRPWRPGTCPKYIAVAHPSANDADLLTACHASSRTTGRNGTSGNQASDVPMPPSADVQRAYRHRVRHATLPLLARRVAEQLDLVAVGVHGVEALRHAVVGR